MKINLTDEELVKVIQLRVLQSISDSKVISEFEQAYVDMIIDEMAVHAAANQLPVLPIDVGEYRYDIYNVHGEEMPYVSDTELFARDILIGEPTAALCARISLFVSESSYIRKS